MKAFWRKVPLSHNERALYRKCLEAHQKATFRQNLSSAVIRESYYANGQDFLKAVASGLGTTGGLHAPIIQAYEFLNGAPDPLYITFAIDRGEKIPGWGSAFVKGTPDKIVETAMLYVDTGWPDWGKHIEFVTDTIHSRGKMVWPNMACLTAVTAHILGMPKTLAPALFLQGRAMAWAEIIYDGQRQPPETPLRPNGERV